MAKERIERSRRFLGRLWRLENDDRPAFLISYAGPRVKGGKPVLINDSWPETDLEEIYRLLGAGREGQ